MKAKLLITVSVMVLFPVVGQSQRTSNSMWRVGTGVSATALSQSDISNLPIRVSITGDLLKTFDIAVTAFKEESLVPPQKRNLENYTVEFRERRGFTVNPARTQITADFAGGLSADY